MDCVVCGKPAVFVCDYPLDGRSCDAPLCGRCRVNVGLKDYCPGHPPLKVKLPTRWGNTIVIDDDGYID